MTGYETLHQQATALMAFGGLLLLGLATEAIGRMTRLPRVTLLLCVGFLIGPDALALLPPISREWFVIIASLALVMVGFLLGGKLELARLRSNGRRVFAYSVSISVLTLAVVTGGLWLLGVELSLGLMLGAIAVATAPAAVMDVVREAQARGAFTDTLLGVVAVDDVWGLLMFSVVLAFVATQTGPADVAAALAFGARDLGGAMFIGAALGIPAAFLTGRIRPGEPTTLEALGIVLLCGGIALYFDVSFLLASIVMGAIVANLASHHEYPFHAIENIEQPFLVLFFVLSGASLKIGALLNIGLLGLAYVVLRVLGRLAGAWLGGRCCAASASASHWMALAMLPQAGVALGMALVASTRYPEYADVVLPLVIGATVVFELSGPIFTRLALRHVGEVEQR
jgi:Kef-type K+ transport system membrane component KefB